ncbi:hypothetical protein BDN72DRAFT_901252 [Pluteus cervinus]|uniref:Uncharacterized protein n=1 Tax=Pluteus cervinus TaxID=181527 RepID=A0ACD3AFZ0_9AGAR|nr:hypothetical protein BDN72DRAFT_901252 [Pluteus cervinus]
MTIDRDLFHWMLPHLASYPAPKLNALSIYAANSTHPLHIPDDVRVFQGITPQLTSLSSSQCRLSPQSSLFVNNLTTLDVAYCPIGSTTTWLDILRQMQRLSHLQIHHCFTDRPGVQYTPIPAGFDVIPFLHLSTLAIKGSWLQSDLDFLTHIALSSRTLLQFNSAVDNFMPPVTASPLLAFLSVHRQSRQGLLEMEGAIVELEQSHSTSLQFPVHETPQYYINLDISNIPSIDYDEALFTELATLFSRTTSMTFTLSCNLSPDILRTLSRHLPNIRTISCSGHVFGAFLTVLHSEPQGAHTSQADDTHPATFPNPLLNHSNIQPPFKSLESIHLSDTTADNYSTPLVDSLGFRRAIGLPIRNLRFSRVVDKVERESNSHENSLMIIQGDGPLDILS